MFFYKCKILQPTMFSSHETLHPSLLKPQTISLETFSAILVSPVLDTIYHRNFGIWVLGYTIVHASLYKSTQTTNIGICFSNYSNNHIHEKSEPRQERKGIMIEQKGKKKYWGKFETKYSDLTHIIVQYLKHEILKKNSFG